MQAATAAGEQLRLDYLDRLGVATSRVVEPLGLALKGRAWYLVAATGEGLRTFRVARIASIVPTGVVTERPAGFDLAATWGEVVERVDELRSPAEVVVLADPDAVDALEWAFEGRVQRGSAGADGRVEVGVRGRNVAALARQLAAFDGAVEIVRPAEARETAARLGAALLARYAPASAGAR